MAAAAAAKAQPVRYATKPKTGTLPTCVDVFHDIDLRDISWGKKKLQAALAGRAIELKDNQMVHFVNKANTKARTIVRHAAGIYSVWCWIVDNKGDWYQQHADNTSALCAFAGNQKVTRILERIQEDALARSAHRAYRRRLATAAVARR
ncbi:MAG: hypothetical protein ACYTEQ_15605 [Planctomycetota bacterium]|jgi:hypothetical protein